MTNQEENINVKGAIIAVIFSILVIGGIIAGCMAGIPRYKVWKREMQGKAEFAQAEQNRKIKIENGQLTTTYIQYLWVRQQSNNNIDKIVYIPTEASMPILEAKQ